MKYWILYSYLYLYLYLYLHLYLHLYLCCMCVMRTHGPVAHQSLPETTPEAH